MRSASIELAAVLFAVAGPPVLSNNPLADLEGLVDCYIRVALREVPVANEPLVVLVAVGVLSQPVLGARVLALELIQGPLLDVLHENVFNLVVLVADLRRCLSELVCRGHADVSPELAGAERKLVLNLFCHHALAVRGAKDLAGADDRGEHRGSNEGNGRLAKL